MPVGGRRRSERQEPPAAGRRPPQVHPPRLQRVGGFFREYTAGIDTRDLQRLFDRDAAQAYAVLTREHAREPEPDGRLRRLLFRARLAFLGISYKLSPARRLLFAAAILAIVLGLLQDPLQIAARGRSVSVEFSPLWFVAQRRADWSSSSPSSWSTACGCATSSRWRASSRPSCCRTPRRPLAGWRFAHSYRTADEVGGDFYDFTPLPDGRLALPSATPAATAWRPAW